MLVREEGWGIPARLGSTSSTVCVLPHSRRGCPAPQREGARAGPGSRCQRRLPRRWHQRTAIAAPAGGIGVPVCEPPAPGRGCSPRAGEESCSRGFGMGRAPLPAPGVVPPGAEQKREPRG